MHKSLPTSVPLRTDVGFDGSVPPNTQKTEVRGWVSRAHYRLKRHALKQIAVNRAVFDKVKEMLY